MGYFIRNTAEFQNELGRHYKVIIFDDDLTGDSSDTFTLSKRGFDLTYETED